MIPTDGRKHGPDAEYANTYFGDTVGRWEGDTLVLDSIGFIDTTWLGRGGFFHSDKMHVVEKFTRQGDAIFYDVTLEDPEVLAEPLVFPTRMLRRNAGANAGLIARTRQLRDELRNRSGRHTDSTLSVVDDRNVQRSTGQNALHHDVARISGPGTMHMDGHRESR